MKGFGVAAWAILAAMPGVVYAETPRPYTSAEKAYYADAQTVQFVRPGLIVKILSAKIASDGTITVGLYHHRSGGASAR